MADAGETVKWLWRLVDGALVETVLMAYGPRSTACISSQAGCAMGCGFCATGQAGFERNLSEGEIVEQVVRARRRAGSRRLSNVVFMGMGEPLANYDRVVAAATRYADATGRRVSYEYVMIDGINDTAVDAVALLDLLRGHGVTATVRRNRGTDIAAACGQLRSRELMPPEPPPSARMAP